MKRMNKEILKLRIKILKRILAAIGITAVVISCGNNSETNVEGDNGDSSQVDVIVSDTVPSVDANQTEDETPPQQTQPVKPGSNTNTQNQHDIYIPDAHPATKYGVPVDFKDEDKYQAKYGVPMP
jgi:hypothetical protein